MSTPRELTINSTSLPPDTGNLKAGKYHIESREQGNVVAKDGKVVTNDWLDFHTGALTEDFIKNISHLQLITECKDKAIAKDPREGNWCWFELGIVRGTSKDSAPQDSVVKEEALCWMSHENAFMTEEFEWREGNVFSQGHPLLESLKASFPYNLILLGEGNGVTDGLQKGGDRIQVRLCARFEGWGISATKGYLFLHISGASREPILLPQNAVKPQILVAQAEGDTGSDPVSVTTVLEDCNERHQVQCVTRPGVDGDKTTAPLANDSLLISKVPSPSEGNILPLLNIESEFPAKRILVVLNGTATSQSNMDSQAQIENKKTGLSWDQTVENSWKQFGVDGLQCPYHLLVRFGHQGVIYRDPAHPNDLALIFEPGSCEGRFSDERLEARLDTIFMAGLASCLAKESRLSILHLCETQIKQAVITGLQWCRRAQLSGGALNLTRDKLTCGNLMLETTIDPVFIPVRLSRPKSEQGSSSLIFRTLPYDPSSTEAATEVALLPISDNGKDDLLPYVPTAKFGCLVTADRREIDSFRDIAHRLEDYLLQENITGPFPIAVFGRPGSGKSFGVKEVIKSIFKETDKKKHDLEWNLSQFEKLSDLTRAFTNISEVSVNEMPVVYFDEFDATHDKTPLYWVEKLTNHLEEFKNGRRGVYVFIGGTAETFEEFQLQPSRRVEELTDQAKDGEYPNSCQNLKTIIESTFSKENQVLKTLRFQPPGETGTTSQELMKVFNLVRHDRLGKSTNPPPIVFFDNFGETRQGDILGWLKYFLAPMQDGEFFDGETTQELGQAIFVFIEGNMGHFESFLDNPDMSDVFKHAKGPDFVSRLSGQFANNMINKPGDGAAKPVDLTQVLQGYKIALNKYESELNAYNSSLDKWKKEGSKSGEEPKQPKQPKPLSIGVFRTDDTIRKQFATLLRGHIDIQGPNKVHDGDDMFVIRRAVMLRNMLQKRGLQGKFRPESDVLRALLRVPRLRHGARSLETILAMSCIPEANSGDTSTGVDGASSGSPVAATEKKKEEAGYFQTDHLPPDSQLKLHVDLKSWKEYLNSPSTEQSCSKVQNKAEDGDAGLDDAQRRRLAEIQWIVLRRGRGYKKESLY